jgi:hypothetical protein
VDPDDKDHIDHVLEVVAKKVVRDMSSNIRIHATNAYLKRQGVHSNDF